MDGIPFAAIGATAGLIVGSFIATLVLRWPKAESVMTGRSRCDGCGKALGVAELVPLFGYFRNNGNCSDCGAAIDPRHPILELMAGAIGALSFAAAPGIGGLEGALFGWTLLALAALDADYFWLPDRLTLPLVAAGLAFALVVPVPTVTDRLIGAVAGYAALASIAWAYRRMRGREGLGGGDAKLLAAIGAWLGWQALPFVLLGASGFGMAAVLVAAARGHRVAADARMPLGAFMAAAAWLLWLWLTLSGNHSPQL